MTYFLAKTEPSTYSIDRLRQDIKTTWDGVKNPQAVRAIREMRTGDRVFIYHTGGESAIVGVAEVLSSPVPYPNEPKSFVVDLKYVNHLTPPTTLFDVKQSKLFEDFALVRQGRLSTMTAPDTFVNWMRERNPKTKI
jgi:predicted RNA-binding protein with PUA-like domain